MGGGGGRSACVRERECVCVCVCVCECVRKCSNDESILQIEFELFIEQCVSSSKDASSVITK